METGLPRTPRPIFPWKVRALVVSIILRFFTSVIWGKKDQGWGSDFQKMQCRISEKTMCKYFQNTTKNLKYLRIVSNFFCFSFLLQLHWKGRNKFSSGLTPRALSTWSRFQFCSHQMCNGFVACSQWWWETRMKISFAINMT